MERITSRRLAAEVSTLYAELLEQLTVFEARRSIGQAAGSFVTKSIKGQIYYYFQHSPPGGALKQTYLGRKSPELDQLAGRFLSERSDAEADRASVERLCALLRVGGAATTDAASARVIGALADAAVFRLGGVLVGTHAFIAIGNMLGVRFTDGLLRTDDVDVAGEQALSVAVPDLKADVPVVLQSLEMGFLPVPGLSPKEPATSFKVRGRSLRVDLLTPATKRTKGPVFIQRFGAAAEPLRYLDYLLEDTQNAAVIDGGGVLVQVPQPARFALHKLLVARSRPAVFQTKGDKDLRQAAFLIDVLSEDRPGDLGLALEALLTRGRDWKKAFDEGLALLIKRAPDAANRLRTLQRSKSRTAKSRS